MVFSDQRFDPFEDHFLIGFPIIHILKGIHRFAVNFPDERLLSISLSETHDKGSVTACLPWYGRIETDQTGRTDEVKIAIVNKIKNNLCSQIGGTVTPHRICIIRSYEHQNKNKNCIFTSF